MRRRFAVKLLLSLCILLLTIGVTSGAAQTPPKIAAPSLPGLHAPGTQEIIPIFLLTSGNSTQPSMAIDSAGGIHVGASPVGAAEDGTHPAYYAYCPGNCAYVINWSIVQLEDLGQFGGYVRLTLDSNGHPRMMWLVAPDLADGEYHYAECNAQCTLSSSWSVGNTGPAPFEDDGRYFALDNLNRPRLILYVDTYGYQGTYYRFCDADCTNSASWWETWITSDQTLKPSLVFTTGGNPRFLAMDVSGSPNELHYFACDGGCDNTANWQHTGITTNESGMRYSLRLDQLDRPRIALYTGYNNAPDDFTLIYAWCDAACIDPMNWFANRVGLDTFYGLDPDLVINSQNQPEIAFYIDAEPYGLGYAFCTANCETDSPSWDGQLIETADELNASYPVPVEPGCSISSWFPGESPALALNNSGQPVFAYTAKHEQGGSCAPHTDITLVRVAMSGGGGGGGAYHTLLPLVRR